MAAHKSERLLNLLITLLVSQTHVSKERLRAVIPEYAAAGSVEAFEKMFERDKDDLRALGVPIEVGSPDPLFGDEPGYRIVRDHFELPEISLTPQEAAVVGLAARVWQHAGLASATSDAVVKLKAAGVDVDRAALDMIQPQLVVDEPAFETIWEALRTRTPITFDYRKPDDSDAVRRHLQPWGVATYRGRWYVAGFDTDRDAVRLFRMSRITGTVTLGRTPGAYVVPDDLDLGELTSALAPPPLDAVATLLVREGCGLWLRNRAKSVPGESGRPGWDRLQVEFSRDGSIVDEILGYGADIIVEDPAELRDYVIGKLRESA